MTTPGAPFYVSAGLRDGTIFYVPIFWLRPQIKSLTVTGPETEKEEANVFSDVVYVSAKITTLDNLS